MRIPLPIQQSYFEHKGSEAGSVFSHSILDIGIDSPMVILANGTSVEWSEGSPVYSENSFISTSEDVQFYPIFSFCVDQTIMKLGLGNTVESSGYVTLNQEPIVVDEGKDHTCAFYWILVCGAGAGIISVKLEMILLTIRISSKYRLGFRRML